MHQFSGWLNLKAPKKKKHEKSKFANIVDPKDVVCIWVYNVYPLGFEFPNYIVFAKHCWKFCKGQVCRSAFWRLQNVYLQADTSVNIS